MCSFDVCSLFTNVPLDETIQYNIGKDVTLVLPYLSLHSDAITRRLKSCVNKFYGVFPEQSRRIKSFFPYKDRFNRLQKSKIVYKASCWDCDAFYIGKTKRRLHDRKTEHFGEGARALFPNSGW